MRGRSRSPTTSSHGRGQSDRWSRRFGVGQASCRRGRWRSVAGHGPSRHAAPPAWRRRATPLHPQRSSHYVAWTGRRGGRSCRSDACTALGGGPVTVTGTGTIDVNLTRGLRGGEAPVSGRWRARRPRPLRPLRPREGHARTVKVTLDREPSKSIVSRRPGVIAACPDDGGAPASRGPLPRCFLVTLPPSRFPASRSAAALRLPSSRSRVGVATVARAGRRASAILMGHKRAARSTASACRRRATTACSSSGRTGSRMPARRSSIPEDQLCLERLLPARARQRARLRVRHQQLQQDRAGGSRRARPTSSIS